MKKNFLARITSFVLMVMLAFTMIPSGLAFAEDPVFSIELTADKFSVAKDGTLLVTVTAKGDFKDIIGLQYGLVYDPTEFTVDTSNTGTRKEPRYDNLFDETWFDENSINDYTGIGEGLDTLEVGTQVYKADTTKELLTVLWYTGDPDYYINSDVEIYGATSVELGKIKLKALKDVANVATSVTLVNQEMTWLGSKIAPSVAVQIPNLDMAAVANVNALISAIPATVTYADKAKVEAAKTAYTALGDAEKALVTGADKITAAENVISGMETAITNVETLIDAIGDVIYPDSKTKIDAARNAYNALTDDAQKAAVENYSKLTEAEAKYAALEANAADKAEAEKVDVKIEAIGTVKYTEASKALIDEADAAYKALTPTQQGLVTKKDDLDLAIATYNALGGMVNTAEEEFKAMEGKTITIADADALTLLNSTFDALQPEQIVALDAKLGYSSTDKLDEYVSAYETSCNKVNTAKNLIDAIGGVTLESGSDIEAAEAAYDALDSVEKTYVTNYSTLTEAREAYDALVEEAAQNAANKVAAEAVDAKIEAIGTVRLTEESRTLIETANDAYEDLTPAQKTLVTKLSVLDAAVERYNELAKQVSDLNEAFDVLAVDNIKLADKANIQKLRADYDALDNDQKLLVSAIGYSEFVKCEVKIAESEYNVAHAIEMIDYIGAVTLESRDIIEEAEYVYNNLTQDEKGYVTNYSTLTKARETYNTLVESKALADEVVAAINALTPAEDVTKDNVNTVSTLAASARSSYENLPDKTMVPNASVQKLEAVEAACKTVKDDLAAAKVVEDLIATIGTVSLGSLEKIEAAEEAYAGLTGTQQSYVANYDVLVAARATYDELKAEQDAIDAVEALIDAIGEVSLGSLADIEAAENAYAELGSPLDSRVENYQTLLDAREKYNELVASQGRVNAVIEQINAIGEVTLGSIGKIQAAEAAYEALSDDEKANVENYQTLLNAREEYEALKAAADKEEADRAAAEAVDNMITALGDETDITLESETDIKAARAAYEALTDDQKAYVNNLTALEAAEATLEGLKADKAAIDEVIDAISQIGEVVYPDSKDAIDAAQAAYDNLADNLKDGVTNYGVLTAAQQKYEALEADYNAVQNVIGLIDAIGEVEYTVAVKERIDAADVAYLALREELRAEVTNADVLEDAKAKYEELKPEISETEEAVTEYGDKYMMVITNIPAGKKVTVDGVEAFEYVEGEDVYYVALGSSKLNASAIIVEDGTSNTLLMGDTDGNGTVDALDAFAANNKSANYDVASYTDAMAFVRSDINGSGTITAYDALMIARIAAGVQGVVVNFAAGK